MQNQLLPFFQHLLFVCHPMPQAKALSDLAGKVVALAEQGITNFRGRYAGIARQHNALLAREEAQERERQRELQVGHRSSVCQVMASPNDREWLWC